MIAPLSLTEVYDGLLKAQRVLNPELKWPIINRRAILVLSHQVGSVTLGDVEFCVLEFFERYLIIDSETSITGFFMNSEDAVEFLQSQITY
jgi:hypothetical protein